MYKTTSSIVFKNFNSIRTVLTSSKMQIVRISSGQEMISKKSKLEAPEEVLFLNFLNFRREQAHRSIVIKFEKEQDFFKLQTLCNLYGKNLTMFKYQINKNHYVLVEFQKIEELKNLLNNSNKKADHISTHIEGKEFMFFNCQKFNFKSLQKFNGKIMNTPISSSTKADQVLQNLKNKAIDDQFFLLFNNLKLNELETRLRFLTCRQMESIIQGIIPHATVYPFGSSVSGLGLRGCDLDLVILKENSVKPITYEKTNKDSEVSREVEQRHLEILYHIINCFGKGCSNVNFIKNAKVPIIKYKNEYTGVECDLSAYKIEGLKMTQALYIFFNLDERVKPFISFIRIWAKTHNLVSPKNHPNQNLSNFCLTILVIFFLQQNSQSHSAILPPFNCLETDNRSDLLRDEEIAFSVSDFKSKFDLNKKSLYNLLFLYFKFYSNFNFNKFGCCPKTGEIIYKNDKFLHSPLYIKNPFEPDRNISQNVSLKTLNNFQQCARLSYKIMDGNNNSSKNKGILELICSSDFYEKVENSDWNISTALNVKDIFVEK